MSLADQLAPNVDPTTRDYIAAVVAEAVAPIKQAAELDKAEREAVIAALRREIAELRGGS